MSASALADEEGRKVFIGGLSFDAREDDLRNDFGKFGDLEDVQLPMGDMGKHKGFAFITYFKAEDAQDACKEHHQKEYLGREITAKVVVPRSERGDRGGGYGRGLPPLSQEMQEKLDEWVAAKRRRDFETSDRIRAEMKEAGCNPEEYRPKPGSFGGGGGYGGGGYGGGGYGGGGDRYDDRRGGGGYDDRYDDRRGGGRYDDRYDDRRRYDDRDRYDDRRDRDRDYDRRDRDRDYDRRDRDRDRDRDYDRRDREYDRRDRDRY